MLQGSPARQAGKHPVREGRARAARALTQTSEPRVDAPSSRQALRSGLGVSTLDDGAARERVPESRRSADSAGAS